MSDNVWDFVGSNCSSFNFKQFEFSFSIFNRDQSESSFNIIQHSVVFVSFSNTQYIHNTNWEFRISSKFIVNSKACIFVHDDSGNLTSSESKIKFLSEQKMHYLMIIESGRHSLNLCGPWLGLTEQIPPILDKSQDLGVLILFKCFLGPLAISGLFNIQNIIQSNIFHYYKSRAISKRAKTEKHSKQRSKKKQHNEKKRQHNKFRALKIQQIFSIQFQIFFKSDTLGQMQQPTLHELVKSIENNNNKAEVRQKLLQIKLILSSLQPDQIQNLRQFIIDYLKPITRKITNIKNTDLQQEDKYQLQKLLRIVFQIYASGVNKFQLSALQALTELLERDNFFFRKGAEDDCLLENGSEMQTKSDKNQAIYEWISTKSIWCQKYTQFYFGCLNSVLQILSGLHKKLNISVLQIVKPFIKFVNKVSNQLNLDKLNSLYSKLAETLESIVTHNDSLLNFKEAYVDVIRSISELGSQLTNIYNLESKKKFSYLISTYGLALLNVSSLQRKFQGFKIINKESETIQRSSKYLKEQQYVKWLYDNKIIQMLFEQSQKSPILKSCNLILRIVFKRRCLNTENMEKVFQYIEKTKSENRQIVLRNLELDSLRLQYNDYEIIANALNRQHDSDYFEEDLFLISDQCVRFSTMSHVQKFVSGLEKILLKHFKKFKNDKVEARCIKSYIKSSMKMIEKQFEASQKRRNFLKIYDTHFENGFNELGILILKGIFEDLPETGQVSKSKASMLLICERNFIAKSLDSITSSSDEHFKKNVEQTLKVVLKQSSDYQLRDKIQLKQELFMKAVDLPPIFEKLLQFLHYHNEEINKVFQAIVNKYLVDSIPFESIKKVFFRLNSIYIHQCKEYNQQYYFEIRTKAACLKKMGSLKDLLVTVNDSHKRADVAGFIADIYTSFPDSKVYEGEQELAKYLKEVLAQTLTQAKRYQDRTNYFLGCLALVQSLMMSTQTLGVGKYRPHNSLVPISTVQINVINDATYGSDVSQSYWKKVSSNMTLFDLFEQMREKFRCSPCQLILQEGQMFWPEKWNGLTLQQLKIDQKVLKAVKSSKEKIRKEKLLEDDGELTEKARKIFQFIYNIYAVDGKMGPKQCSNFVNGVTKTGSSPHDSRVVQFFKQYDSDKDDNITLQDFLRFYKHHCSPQRDEIVWKNLNHMRFRKDLKKYDDPIEISNEDILFRSVLYRSQEFYEMLFSLTESDHQQISQRCKRLLLRLPTYSKIMQNFHQDLNLIQKNAFQTQYLLIAIQSKLNGRQAESKDRAQNHRKFIQSGNSIQIFDMMIRIDQKQPKTRDEVKCLFISLQILRQLLKVGDLRNCPEQQIQINLKIPETYLFVKLGNDALKKVDIQIFEAAIALQLCQTQSQIELALQGIFHQQVSIRRICCNYIYVLSCMNKVNLNLFQAEIKSNCEYWFETLCRICVLNNQSLNYNQIVKASIEKIRTRRQDIQLNKDDSIIYGNLSIIQTILKVHPQKCPNIFNQMVQILDKIISVRSRKLIYTILGYFDLDKALKHLTSLIDGVQPVREVESKNFFVGLKNLGSTCYMNSILQVLFYVDQFKHMILNLPQKNVELSTVGSKSIYDDTLYQLQRMYMYLGQSFRKFYNTEDFCLTFKISGSNQPIDPRIQQDAHQFVGKFLDKLQKQIERTEKIENFRNLLEGSTVTEVLCKKCNYKISRQQKFCQLSLAVQNLDSLEQSFKKYIEPQQIEDYFCSNCNMKVQKIQKSTYLNKVPQLFTINLQRIIYDMGSFAFKKIDSKFQFPQQLNVFNFVSKQSNVIPTECQYSLKAIVIHSGTSESGHYISIIKINNQWYKFNDTLVTKIEEKDIPKQCFGGQESKQQWSDDLKFSTNAYMLFYQKQYNQQQEKTMQEESRFSQQIQADNFKLYKQLQIHQQSMYLFANQLYQQYFPPDNDERLTAIFSQNWSFDPNLPFYQMIYNFHFRLLKFSTIFTDIKTELLFKIGQNIFRSYCLLPQKTYQFFNQISPDQYIENMVFHNDETIRNIYKCLGNKCSQVYLNYYQTNFESQQEGTLRIIKLLDCLFALIEDQRLMKNILKSSYYFDFWKVSCEFIPLILNYLLQHDMLSILLDLSFGNDSPYAEKNKKRVEIPRNCFHPILKTIVYLTSYKKNLKDQIDPLRVKYEQNCFLLNEKQKNILGNPNFYSRMLNRKYDTGELAPVIQGLCYRNEEFSISMAKLFLKGLNNLASPQVAIIILQYLRLYLLIDDELTIKRIKWILGISQLRMGDQLVYGLTYQDESTAFQYFSPLYFGKQQKDDYKCALSILYENHSTYTTFSLEGVLLLLDLINCSQKIFWYISGLPAPIYLHKTYIDWIYKYIQSFKDSYMMEEKQTQKNHYLNRLMESYKIVSNKVNYYITEPPNKFIIGRNSEINAEESIYTDDYKMTLWSHTTYILPNQPCLTMNKSLPKELFKFGSPQGYAKYFISLHTRQILEQDENINCKKTVFTLEMDNKIPLVLKFKLPYFSQQIRVGKGKVFINFPYQQLKGLSSIVDIQKQGQKLQPIPQIIQQHQMQTQIPDEVFVFCQFCTYQNKITATICEICENAI